MKRFWDKVNKTQTCWLWTAAKDETGRGYFNVNQKAKRVHRLSYEMHKGPIPNGLLVCHTCDVPSCVNPDHLFLGTNAENMRDMGNKKRSKFHKVKFMGTKHGMSKLTDEDVLEIRSRYRFGNGHKLAKEFGISTSVISAIVNNKIWKHLL
jgi:hypothetical protein